MRTIQVDVTDGGSVMADSMEKVMHLLADLQITGDTREETPARIVEFMMSVNHRSEQFGITLRTSDPILFLYDCVEAGWLKSFSIIGSGAPKMEILLTDELSAIN